MMKCNQTLLAIFAWIVLAIGMQAAISVSPSGYTNNFAAMASITNSPPTGWWTRSVTGGDGSTIANVAQLDASVQTNSAQMISNGLGASTTTPPSSNAVARWNGTLLNLQTRPTGNMYTLLLAELRNDTGADCDRLMVSYDLGVVDPSGAVEELPGQHLYYSLTGMPGSWNSLGTFSNASRISFSVTLSSLWTNGTSLYLLWADDNGSGADYAYQIDNLYLAGVAARAGASAVTWTVDPTNSYIRLTIPDQAINVTNIGNVTIRLRDASSTSQWTDAGGRRAALSGELATEYADGKSISFRGGAHNLVAVEATSLRPNPADWSEATTNYTGTSTAAAALGARVRGTYKLIFETTFDMAYLAFRQVRLDLANATGDALVITNGVFATNATLCGIATAQADVDGLELPLSLGQPVPDVRQAAMGPMVELNSGGGSVTNMGGLNRKLTYTISIPNIALDLSGTTVTGSASGLVIAYATLPGPVTPPRLQVRQVGTNLVMSWPTNQAGFSLSYATSLPATAWISAVPAPTIVNGQNVVSNGVVRGAAFYRLSKP